MTESDQPATLTAPRKTFAVVEAMADAGGTVRVTALADELGYTRSTTYKHLATLRELGYVVKEGVEYSLSYRFVSVGERVRQGSALYHAAKPHVDQLAETTDETAGIVVKQGSSAVDLYQSTDHPSEAVLTAPELHCSAPGKAILARLDAAAVDAVVEADGLPARTENTITDREALDAELATARERGITIERGEQREGIHGVAVAFETDETVAAVYVAGHADRLSSKRLEENVSGMVLGTVRRIEESL
ncbi:IclR family transcriptional regulator [Haloarchaeobius iranensis]|uniref:DNA-binding transcriptional regulator, IclR family n=1 Tax=Haloarchaeobius iranensis TaxID=996166 RepID=A0A1G9UWA3_9EURY|nr:IclR family transcriptional regulator [Haloarchaeobius iranensis]SDM64222.1 DNA-binding transcriptional regulator, IclR family [Haloarchaeobius iranensis]